MTDPTIVTLGGDHPDPGRDPYWVGENLESAARLAEHIPARYRAAITDHPQVVAWVKTLVEVAVAAKLTVPSVTTGPSLLISGAVGRGKTFQAWGAIRALSVTGLRVPWKATTASNLYAACRTGDGREAAFQSYAKARLLLLDDLGAAKSTEFTEETNYRLVNHRYENELPTLFTSNVPPKELGEALGTRVASRLVEMTTRVVLTGEDRRRAS